MKSLLVLFVFTTLLYCDTTEGNTTKVKLEMPAVHPDKKDSYICTSLKLPEHDSYIVEYEPNAHKETVHHMLLFGCDEPGQDQKAWNCGDMGAGTCGDYESILFGWARDAPALDLPKDVGFKVGGKTKIKYLVLQIHYGHPLEDGQFDSSGLTLHMTDTRQPNVASIYLLLAFQAYIQPHTKGIHVDIACKYDGDQEIHAFAFRTHAHDLGRVITGYRIRNNNWTLLGKGDPHAPQAFYPMKNITTIKKGDILAARCTYDTYNTDRTEVTHIGSRSGDEMCNFYMMYYRNARSHVTIPQTCMDQYTLKSLFHSFPSDSDVALSLSPGHHHHHHQDHGQDVNVDEDPAKESEEGAVIKGKTQSINDVQKTIDDALGGVSQGESFVHEPNSEQINSTTSSLLTSPTDGVTNPTDDVTSPTGDITNIDDVTNNTDGFTDNTDDFTKSVDVISNTDDVTKSDDVMNNTNGVANNTDDIMDNADDVTNNTDDVTDNTDDDTDNTDDVTDSDVTKGKSRLYATDDNIFGEAMTTRSTKERPEVGEGKSSDYITHDISTDVNTSTSVSERTTSASQLTYEPTTAGHKGKEDFDDSDIGFWKDLTTGRKKIMKTTAQVVESNKPLNEQNGVKKGSKSDGMVHNVSVVDGWPSSVSKRLGQVTGLAVDSAGRLFVFHRAGRTWDQDTFNDDNTFRHARTRGTIRAATILILDGKSGKLLREWGRTMFYLPHGLTIDHEDNVWVTDVGRHQVMKFSRGEFKKPALILGEKLIPGSDEKHFCKPTDVAVEKSGVFYVADGYCNGRIMKFSAKGKLLKKWGSPSRKLDARPGTFSIPHSLALDEKHDMLYVADRENGRIQCFDTQGIFHKLISSKMFGGRVFAVNYNDQDHVLYAVNGPGSAKVQGFTINPTTGEILASWSPRGKGFTQPHDVISSGSYIYVAEIGPNRVWKMEAKHEEEPKQMNYERGFVGEAIGNKPTRASDDGNTKSGGQPRKKERKSNVPAVVLLTILSVPAVILLLVGIVSKIRGRKTLHKYDMMDETLGNHSTPGNWCTSVNCCSKSYHNMEELYLMDSDSDLEIFPDVRVNKK